MNLLKNIVRWVVAVFGLASGVALATVPEEITAMSTDATTTWGLVKAVIVAIVAFCILLSVVVKIRTRR